MDLEERERELGRMEREQMWFRCYVGENYNNKEEEEEEEKKKEEEEEKEKEKKEEEEEVPVLIEEKSNEICLRLLLHYAWLIIFQCWVLSLETSLCWAKAEPLSCSNSP